MSSGTLQDAVAFRHAFGPDSVDRQTSRAASLVERFVELLQAEIVSAGARHNLPTSGRIFAIFP
jgi:hypothetical protein